MTPTSERFSAPRWATQWIWFLGAGIAVIAAYYLLPALHAPAITRDVVSQAFPVGATVALAVGIRAHRPPRRLPWVLLAVAQASNLTGDVINFVQNHVLHVDQYPSPADVCYLAAYPVIGIALVLFVRRRTPGSHAPAVIDAAVISVSLGLLWWLYIVEPLTRAGTKPLETVVNVAYPAMDMVLLAVALRLALGVGARPVAFRLLVGSLLATLLTDALFAVLTAKNLYDTTKNSWLEWGWFVAYLLMGAAGLHPSMRTLDQRAALAIRSATGRRITVLAGAALLPLAVLVVQFVSHSNLNVLSVTAAAVALFLLMLARLRGLEHTQRLLAIHDGLTGAYSRDFLDEAFRMECERARVARGELGVLLVDVDTLGLINEVYGSQAGDIVLAELAARLHAGIRPGDLIARQESDRFVVLLPGAETRDRSVIAERLRESASEPRVQVNDDVSVRVTVSIGLAAMPSDGRTPAELLHAADQALYTAKRAGRNRTYTRHGPVNVLPVMIPMS